MAAKNEDKKKIHNINVTNGAGIVLKSIVPQPGWYEKVPLVETFAAQEFIQSSLADLKAPEGKEGDKDRWAEKELCLNVDESQREGLKKCVKFFLDKAALGLTSHVRILAVELGIL